MEKTKVSGGIDVSKGTLDMATLSTVRHNPVISAFYVELKEKGKKPKVALTACMRKLIVMLNAMMKNNEPWRHVNA